MQRYNNDILMLYIYIYIVRENQKAREPSEDPVYVAYKSPAHLSRESRATRGPRSGAGACFSQDVRSEGGGNLRTTVRPYV